MTEEEAKTKWCPMVRTTWGNVCFAPTDQPPAPGRAYDFELVRKPEGALCIASDCMMWRAIEPDYGFCGLAGKE